MRILQLLLAIALFIVVQYSFGQECPDEVSTDPRNPNNPDKPSLENTFFWFPHNGNDHNNFEILTSGGTYSSINNPFWVPTSLMVGQLANLQNSDFYPEDGWEMLKVNFGRLNNGTERDIKPSMPYMILYNRYSGTMRFLGMWPNASNSWQIIRFRIGLPQKKWTVDDSGSNLDATNLLSIQGEAMQPLDQQTEETVYEVITEYPGISNASFFFWFDLPVAYDPCVCNNDVALTLEATVENQWNVTVKGVIDAQVIQQGVPQSGYSSLVAKRIIGAAGATAAAIATGGAVINTGSFTGLLDIFIQRPGISDDNQAGLELLQAALNAAAEITYDPGKLEWRNTVTGETLTNSDWQKLFSGIGSFLNAGVDFANPGSQNGKPKTSVVGSITATGTATLNQNPGDLVYLGVPGSNWTESLDEIVESTANGLNPEYPIYNNPLGTIALLQTPKIYVSNSDIYYCDEYVDGGGPNEEPYWRELTKTRVKVWLKDDLKYIINPVLNLDFTKTEILASIIIEMPNNSADNSLSCPNPIEDNDLLSPSEQLQLSKRVNLIETVEKDRLMTPPVPLDDFKEVVAEFLIGIPTYTNQIFGEHLRYFVRFTLHMVSNNIGTDGKQVKNTQIVTFPLESTLSFGTASPPVIDIVNDLGSTDFNIAMTELADGNTSFHPDYISISAPLASSNTGSGYYSILSASVIHLKPDAHLSPSLRLAIDLPFQGLYSQPQVSQTYVTNFCQNTLVDNQYQANQFSPLAPQVPTPSSVVLKKLYFTAGDETKVSINPNPTSGFFQVTSTTAFINQIQVYDLSGRRLYHRSFGNNPGRQVQVDLSSLSNGVYVVKTTCGEQVSTEKLVVER